MDKINFNQTWVDSVYLSYQNSSIAYHELNGYFKALKDYELISDEEHARFTKMNDDAYESFKGFDRDPDWERE